MQCKKCGKLLQANAKFCSECGCETQFANLSYTEQKSPPKEEIDSVVQAISSEDTAISANLINVPPLTEQNVQYKAKNSHSKIIIVSAIALSIILFILSGSLISKTVKKHSRINFKKEYSSLSLESWFSIDDGGSWISIDTNPNDKDYKDFTVYDYQTMSAANDKIKEINTHLGFSDALYKSMTETRALDGRQTEENEKYKVSWSYHPKHGLEVLYEYKNN